MTKTAFLRGILLLCGFLSFSLEGLAGECRRTSDCFSNEHCVDNRCVRRSSINRCFSNSDCGSGNQCRDGICRQNLTCHSDRDCLLGFTCTRGNCRRDGISGGGAGGAGGGSTGGSGANGGAGTSGGVGSGSTSGGFRPEETRACGEGNAAEGDRLSREHLTTKAEIAMEDFTSSQEALFFLPGDERVLTVGKASIHIWNIASGKHEETVYKQDDETQRDVAPIHFELASLSHNGEVLATNGGKEHWMYSASFWHLPTGKRIEASAVGGARVSSVALLADGKTALVGLGSGKIQFYDTANGALREEWDVGEGYIYNLKVSANDKTVVIAAGESNDLTVWNLAKRQKLATIPVETCNVENLTILPDNETLSFTSFGYCTSAPQTWKDHVYFFDLATGARKKSYRTYGLDVHQPPFADPIQFAPSGERVVSARAFFFIPRGSNCDFGLPVWKAVDGSPLYLLRSKVPEEAVGGASAEALDAGFSQDGKTVAAIVRGTLGLKLLVWKLPQ